jgi:hypothetical protein
LTAVGIAVGCAAVLIALGILSRPSSAAGADGIDATAPGGKSPETATSTAQRRSIAAPRFGFADDLEQQLLAIDAAQDLRANVGRLPIPWYFSDWALMDKLYDSFYSSGIRPIITLSVTPPPAAGPALPPGPSLPIPPLHGPQPQNLPPPPPVPDVNNFKPSEFAALAVYIAQRYPWAKIQLLNEPNLAFFRSFSVAQTVETVTVAARAVHEVAPTERLIGPAASPDQGRGFAYTREVYSQLPPDLDYVDAATNIYPGPGKTRAFRQVKKSWKTAHATGRKVWVTEITPGIYFPKRRRCNQIKQAFAYLKAKGAKGILFFRLREPEVVQNVQGRLWAVNLDGSRTDLYRCLLKASKRMRKPGRPGKPQLRLKVVNSTFLHGAAVRVRFVATARDDYGSLGEGPKRPVDGALVALEGERTRTNRLGRASITVNRAKPGRHQARVHRAGYRGDDVVVRLGRPPNSGANHHQRAGRRQHGLGAKGRHAPRLEGSPTG